MREEVAREGEIDAVPVGRRRRPGAVRHAGRGPGQGRPGVPGQYRHHGLPDTPAPGRAGQRGLHRHVAELWAGGWQPLRRLRAALRAGRFPPGRGVPRQHVHPQRPGRRAGVRQQGREVRRGLAERRAERDDGHLRPALRRHRRPHGGRVPGEHRHRRDSVRPWSRRRRPGRLRRHLDEHGGRRGGRLRDQGPALQRRRRARGKRVLREHVQRRLPGSGQCLRRPRRPLRGGVGEPRPGRQRLRRLRPALRRRGSEGRRRVPGQHVHHRQPAVPRGRHDTRRPVRGGLGEQPGRQRGPHPALRRFGQRGGRRVRGQHLHDRRPVPVRHRRGRPGQLRDGMGRARP